MLSAACVLTEAESLLHLPHYSLSAALIAITIGSALICMSRTRAIVRDLEQRAH